MKITHAAAKVAVIAAVFLGLREGSASAPNPIPGIDIIVQKKPDGRAMHAATDKAGRFAFDNLEAGTYQLQATVPQTKAPIITTRSNIKRPTLRMEGAVEVFNVSVMAGTGRPAPVEIAITKPGGKIVGTVERAESGTTEKAAGGVR